MPIFIAIFVAMDYVAPTPMDVPNHVLVNVHGQQ